MIDYWMWVIAKGVLLGQLLFLAIGLLVFLVGPWLYDGVRHQRPLLPGDDPSSRPSNVSRRQGAVSARLVLLILLPFAAGILIATKAAGWFAGIFGGEPVAIQHVDPAVIEQARVDPTPGLLERARLGRVQPTQVRIGAAPSRAGTKRVERYCRPAVRTSATPTAVPDSGDAKKNGPRILPDFGGRVNGTRVLLSSTLNDGTPWDATSKVRGRWTFASDGDSVVVRSERLWARLVRGLVRCGALAGAGAGVGALTNLRRPLQGAVRGAAIGGGTCAVLEIAF